MAVLLEAQPERGDVYACQVEHASFPEPVSVQWGKEQEVDRSGRIRPGAGLSGSRPHLLPEEEASCRELAGSLPSLPTFSSNGASWALKRQAEYSSVGGKCLCPLPG
ncbi:hypothetical protein JRQ81_012273 [Phrynocephalus forsythii]|uniref:Ig-like domain-containing protein n=1 Tax=Phrynocephalus forsythii TaxID=171643 RepID=A0A9Q1APW4_9SAUR|nr:hypothetical protein JRQ81_012273 [Phrynocephalus forsythii]